MAIDRTASGIAELSPSGLVRQSSSFGDASAYTPVPVYGEGRVWAEPQPGNFGDEWCMSSENRRPGADR